MCVLYIYIYISRHTHVYEYKPGKSSAGFTIQPPAPGPAMVGCSNQSAGSPSAVCWYVCELVILVDLGIYASYSHTGKVTYWCMCMLDTVCWCVCMLY